MTTFINDGFCVWRERNREWHRDLFALHEAIDSLGHTALGLTGFSQDDKLKMSVVLILVRALSMFEAMHLLAERGLIAEFRLLGRCLLELAFNLGALIKADGFFDEYVAKSLRERKKLLEKTITPNCVPGTADTACVQKEIEACNGRH
ncbi:MAG: hypothetical protein HY735_21940 [Verrucomicrobia bacterium]|nr:hypothetical protein [Verrucomicrobiota bacterium]